MITVRTRSPRSKVLVEGRALVGDGLFGPAPTLASASPAVEHVDRAGAIARGLLVAMLMLIPYAWAPTLERGLEPLVAIVALLTAAIVASEYLAPSPSLIEFRDARPYNRLRFGAFAGGVLGANLMLRSPEDWPSIGQLFHAVGERLGQWLDVAGSPFSLIARAVPESAPPEFASSVVGAAAVAHLCAGFAVALFYLRLRRGAWPRSGGLNLWVNLPHFDPTAGGDVVERLQRGAKVSLALGLLAPFILPMAFLEISGAHLTPTDTDPVSLAWYLAVWAIVPASLVMRGLTLGRIAQSLDAQRANLTSERSTPKTQSERRLRAA